MALSRISRRDALTGLASLSAAALVGCGREARPEVAARLPELIDPQPPPREIDLDELLLPDRKARALSGSAFIDKTRSMTWNQREAAVVDEVLSGNVPSFLRKLVPVHVSCASRTGRQHAMVLRVAPDYVCIGSDQDFIRMPMNGRTAQRIATATGCVLPTTKLVDWIYDHAKHKLASISLPHGARMMSSGYFLDHHQDIEARRRKLGGKLGDLCAGHKKDIVISRRLEFQRDRLAIYGWHRDDRRAIQLLSTFHEDTYVDYTHGVRLVAQDMTVDGETHAVREVLRDHDLWMLLSFEGPVRASYAT